MVDSALPQPGDIIAAKYRIERAIGDGGMSVVFGATHCVTGKRFAIKWLLPDDEAATSALAAQRFIREAQVAGLFQHPNVVEVYDVGEVSGSYYMVMEWLEGESLDTRLARVGRLSLHEACAYLIPCMQGIEEAHAVGIVHRDLKPANIFVCQATKHAPERAKVLDFGIAKLTNPSTDRDSLTTQAGVLIGTPSYLAPEQLRNQAVDHRTDIYAFGVVLYQVLSGELPFMADTFGELVLQIATSTPRPLRELVPELPPGVDALVARAMAREPAERFQELSTLIDALRAYAEPAYARTTPARGQPLPASGRSSMRMATPLATEAKSLAPPGPAPARPLRLPVRVALALTGLALTAGLWLFIDQRAQPAGPIADSALPPIAGARPSEPRVATETAIMAATPASKHNASDEPPKALPFGIAPPEPELVFGVSQADAGIVSPGAQRAKPQRARPARVDAPARVPAEAPARAPTERESPPPSAPPPSAPPPPIDHNPLHMEIQ
jgi:serine/threonine protein kinase